MRRTMKQSPSLLAALVLIVLLAACQPAPPRPVVQPTASPTPQPPIAIGAILNLDSDAGPDGLQRLEAAKLAVDLVNRRGGVVLASGERRLLSLVVYDDGGRPDTAEASLRRLANDGVPVVLGPSAAESVAVVRRAAEAASVPLIALSDQDGGEAGSWRWTFSLAAHSEDSVAAALDFFAASGVERIGWLAPRTMDASTLRRTLFRLAAASRIQIVGEEQYAPGSEDFAPGLARVQAGNPSVILAWPRDSHEAAAIVRDAGKARDLAPIFLGPAAATPSTLTLVGDGAAVVRTLTLRLGVADDLWDHDALTPVIRDFRRELQAQTGRVPTAEAAAAWDAVRLIVATLEQVAPTRTAIRDALEGTGDYLGASGTISFTTRRHDGLDRRAFVVARSDARRWRLPP